MPKVYERRHPIWFFFHNEIGDPKVACKYCEVWTGNASNPSNMKKHLEKHTQEYAQYLENLEAFNEAEAVKKDLGERKTLEEAQEARQEGDANLDNSVDAEINAAIQEDNISADEGIPGEEESDSPLQPSQSSSQHSATAPNISAPVEAEASLAAECANGQATLATVVSSSFVASSSGASSSTISSTATSLVVKKPIISQIKYRKTPPPFVRLTKTVKLGEKQDYFDEEGKEANPVKGKTTLETQKDQLASLQFKNQVIELERQLQEEKAKSKEAASLAEASAASLAAENAKLKATVDSMEQELKATKERIEELSRGGAITAEKEVETMKLQEISQQVAAKDKALFHNNKSPQQNDVVQGKYAEKIEDSQINKLEAKKAQAESALQLSTVQPYSVELESGSVHLEKTDKSASRSTFTVRNMTETTDQPDSVVLVEEGSQAGGCVSQDGILSAVACSGDGRRKRTARRDGIDNQAKRQRENPGTEQIISRERLHKAETNTDDENGYMPGDSLDEINKSKRLNTINKHNFDVILNKPAFDTPEARKLYKEMQPEEFTMEYYQSTGIECPLRFNCDPVKLGMKIPSSTLTVDQVMELVDPNLILEVVQVSDQSAKSMTGKEWVVYYNTPAEQKKAIYNALSLEFDQTKLRELVESPALVRMIDWLEKWPKGRRGITHQPLNNTTYRISSTYPKISYYCIMSPNKSYTDFHVDFGGSSVWYHVLRGQKIFWIIEPTETNLRLYEEHLKDQKQKEFFGNVVDRCACVVLKQGETLVIPAGWIHAVYTPADSIVFGGNFLHTLAASMQIRIIQSENRVKISSQYRIPYFEEVHFYTIADFVEKATGRRYARPLFTFAQETNLAEKHAYFEEQVNNESEQYTSDRTKKKEADLRFFNETFEHSRETIFYDWGDVPKESLIGAVHRFPIDVATDGEIGFDENFIQTITPRALAELQVLYDYMYNKLKIQVAEGVTQPASLLNCFQQVLLHREKELNRLGTPIPQPVAAYKGRNNRIRPKNKTW